MTEAMRKPLHSTGHSGGRSAGVPLPSKARVANGTMLRWTPGPDELRLPSCDGEPMTENTRQLVAIVDCFDSLQRRWIGWSDVFVGANQFIHWDPTCDHKTNPANPPRALDVVSPSSRKLDAEEKPRIYAAMGVPEFFLYDPYSKLEPALSGFALHEVRRGGKAEREYRPLPGVRLLAGVSGVRSKVLGLCLCTKPPGPRPLDCTLCWYDPEKGEFLTHRLELEDGKR